MPANGGPAIIKIPATVYPGMFRGEVQVSIRIEDREINLMVSEDFVEFNESELSNEGVPGILIADIVSKTDEGYLVHLPGEAQGATNRVEWARST
jgi:hypothetical protein